MNQDQIFTDVPTLMAALRAAGLELQGRRRVFAAIVDAAERATTLEDLRGYILRVAAEVREVERQEAERVEGKK